MGIEAGRPADCPAARCALSCAWVDGKYGLLEVLDGSGGREAACIWVLAMHAGACGGAVQARHGGTRRSDPRRRRRPAAQDPAAIASGRCQGSVSRTTEAQETGYWALGLMGRPEWPLESSERTGGAAVGVKDSLFRSGSSSDFRRRGEPGLPDGDAGFDDWAMCVVLSAWAGAGSAAGGPRLAACRWDAEGSSRLGRAEFCWVGWSFTCAPSA